MNDRHLKILVRGKLSPENYQKVRSRAEVSGEQLAKVIEFLLSIGWTPPVSTQFTKEIPPTNRKNFEYPPIEQDGLQPSRVHLGGK